MPNAQLAGWQKQGRNQSAVKRIVPCPTSYQDTFEEDLNIILSVPGIGLTSAATILAENGDYRDFQNADTLAMYFGIVPAVYQSTGKLRTGKITKRGSKHMRRILVQVAKAISKTKKSSSRRDSS